jgi:hypothetical protein
VEEGNDVLRMKVEVMTKGWRRSLENINSTYEHVLHAQLTAFEYCDGEVRRGGMPHPWLPFLILI